jgi:hypothetical protein
MQITGCDITGVNTTGQAGIAVTNTLGVPQSVYPSIISGCTFYELAYGVTIDAATAGITVGQNVYGAVTTPALNNSDTGSVYGEYIEQVRASGSSLPLTTSVAPNVCSISLPAGDWDISATVVYTGTATTVVNYLGASVGLTSATIDQVHATETSQNGATAFLSSGRMTMPVGPHRFTLTARTTVYLVAMATFSASTANVYGRLQARRNG